MEVRTINLNGNEDNGSLDEDDMNDALSLFDAGGNGNSTTC